MKSTAALIGFLLTVALAASWWHGYRNADTLSLYLAKGAGQFVVSSRGCVGIVLTDVPAGAAWSWDATSRPDELMDEAWLEIENLNYCTRRGWKRFCGLKCVDSDGNTRLVAAVVPTPALLALTLPPLLFGVRRVRRQRYRTKCGLCPACGYDLRHSTGRCPECGRVIDQPAT